MTTVASRSLQWLAIPASDQTRAELSSALAELYTMAAWCCVDSGYHDHARAHFARAVDLAPHDPFQLASAMRHVGIQMVDAGAFNDGLTAFQLGLIKLADSPPGPGTAEATAWLSAESALPLAAMGRSEEAIRAISSAREHELSDPFDLADLDYLTSCVYQRLGRVDAAERFAASSVHRWKASPDARRDSVEAAIALASLHARAGELDAVSLAHQAIAQVEELRSARARTKLRSLVEALETRSSRADFAELALRARQLSCQQACDQ